MSIIAECWRPVVDAADKYEVSDQQGRIRNSKTGRVLKPWTDSKGYARITINQKQRKVHRIVLEAFVGPCPEGCVTLHGPNGITDNSLSNLSWGTQHQNVLDRKRDGTNNAPRPRHRGSLNHQAQLSEIEVLEIFRLKGVLPQWRLAKAYDVSEGTISNIHTGRKWGHLTKPDPSQQEREMAEWIQYFRDKEALVQK